MITELNDLLRGAERLAWQMRSMSDELSKQGEEALRWRERGARLSAAGWTLTQVVADYRLFAIWSAFVPRAGLDRARERLHQRNARRLLRTCIRQQGAFLKLGQSLSCRPDLLPAAWHRELSTLQDQAPAEPFARLQPLLEAELGGPIGERFASFDERPLAAASIGQVHRAVTLDGVEVAVKVQRPDVAGQIDHDLALLDVLLESTVDLLPPADYPTIAAELREMIALELDYQREAEMMSRAARLFAGTPGVIVPEPIAALSTRRVLTTPFVRGDKITTALEAGSPELASQVLGTLLEVYLRQVLHAGCFQADPHPGNFLVTPDGHLVLLDFGCTRELDDQTRAAYRQLVSAFFADDREKLTALFAQLGFATRSGRPDTLLCWADALLAHLRSGALKGSFDWPSREQLLADAASLMATTEADPIVAMPSEFVMLGRVLGALGGLFGRFRPEIDWARRILPNL